MMLWVGLSMILGRKTASELYSKRWVTVILGVGRNGIIA